MLSEMDLRHIALYPNSERSIRERNRINRLIARRELKRETQDENEVE